MYLVQVDNKKFSNTFFFRYKKESVWFKCPSRHKVQQGDRKMGELGIQRWEISAFKVYQVIADVAYKQTQNSSQLKSRHYL